MTKIIFIAHPEIANSTVQSFLLAGLASLAPEVQVEKISQEPRTVAEYQQMILTADEVIFQFPLYWYHAPAALAQFQEDVFTNSFVQELQAANQARPRKFGLVVSYSQKRSDFQAGTVISRTLSELLSSYQSFANYLGFSYQPIFEIAQFSYLTESSQQKLLISYLQRVQGAAENFLTRGQWFLQQLGEFTPAPQLDVVKNYLAKQLAEYQNLDETLGAIKDGQQ